MASPGPGKGRPCSEGSPGRGLAGGPGWSLPQGQPAQRRCPCPQVSGGVWAGAGGTHCREGEPSNHQGASAGPHTPEGSGSPGPLSWRDWRVSRDRSSCGFKFVSHFWTTLPGACRGLRFFFGKHCNYPVNGTIIFVRVLKVFICSM